MRKDEEDEEMRKEKEIGGDEEARDEDGRKK